MFKELSKPQEIILLAFAFKIIPVTADLFVGKLYCNLP
jgi:hypothetical protein